jgi:ubiquitin-associated SH3 domain-containing protein
MKGEDMVTKFILYACPTGQLADQIDAYFETAKTAHSWNPALDYMPHCSLTGFFHDTPTAAQHYIHALDHILARMGPSQPHPVMHVTGMYFYDDFHGLTLQSSWLADVTKAFAATTCLEMKQEPIRIKEWLHLSLAYRFKPDEHQALKALARQSIDPRAAVGWELRFYQRQDENRWTCHGCWPLSKSSRHIVETPACLTVITPAAAAPPASLHLNVNRKS